MSKEDKAMESTQLSAEANAESKMFNMIQEAGTSVTKTIGEALGSTARKQ